MNASSNGLSLSFAYAITTVASGTMPTSAKVGSAEVLEVKGTIAP
jgi:hypothetical protein